MKIPIDDFSLIPYNSCYKDYFEAIFFTFSDIEQALLKKDWENRSFQASLSELRNEWDSVDKQTSVVIQKKYHIKRIATIIHYEIWKEPIIVYNDRKTILDGGHRLWAMYTLKMTEIDAIIIKRPPELTHEQRESLWNTISILNGNAKQALKSMNIEFEE